MCRSINRLFNTIPSADRDDFQAAALQYVRKISGYRQPSKANEAAFQVAVEEISATTERLVASLATSAPPHPHYHPHQH